MVCAAGRFGHVFLALLLSCSDGDETCRILADKRLEEPLSAIAKEYGSPVELKFLPASEVKAQRAGYDAVFCMEDFLTGAKKVAWTYPAQKPVFAAALTKHPRAADFIDFAGGPIGHRLWSESKAGFTIVPDRSSEAYEWVAENRVKHTYPLTAMRMLGEIGGIRDGICIDIGCGPGHLEVELAKRSKFKIIGLDIDEGAKPLFEKRIREAGLEDRVSFVVGDAQKMPFPDNYADVIVSRGTLVFIPDIGKCLREVQRVLKPTGVAFLGGRYLYTPQAHKITNEKLKEIVSASGVPGARVVEENGQWVKVIGPEAPKAAHQFQGGPHMAALRLVGETGIRKGRCLLLGGGEGVRPGLAEVPDLELVALYATEKDATEARKRGWDYKVGTLRELPFEDASFNLVMGIGPQLIFEKDRVKAMREIYRVLRPGGSAKMGGRFLGMPDSRRVSSETLRQEAVKTGIKSIRISDDGGQWVLISKRK